jgi:alpha-L-rhamnosidase
MGLLLQSDWQARWITHDAEIIRRDPEAIEPTGVDPGTPALFRKAFEVSQSIRRATLYATARGIIDLSLNGKRVSEDLFTPEWTDYHRRLHYRTFDVTALMAAGENVLGAYLGDGWWSGFIGWQETRGQYGTFENSLLLQLEVELSSGETCVVVTDASWRCNTGPILQSDFMLGETYDARRELTGWTQASYDDSSWLSAIEVASPKVYMPEYSFSNNRGQETEDDLPLVAQRSEPVRIVETIQPLSTHEVSPGTFIYDLGQNIAGWVEIELSGESGCRVQLRHGERLNLDGKLYTDNLRRADATDVYYLRGEGEETWSPRFTFHGFQYIELTGLDQPLPLDKLRGCVVMSATEPTGDFECSHPLVNRLWKNALWGQKGNFLSVPTDCPQRDERLGWMGDVQVFLRTATYNMDVAAFFTKWMFDVCDSQDVDGVFPDVAPRLREGDNFVGLDGLGGAAGWGDAGVIVPWTMWRVYGDRRVVERHWGSMVRWLDWLEATNPEGIRENQLGNNYGDWLCIPSDTTFRTHSEMKTLLATAYWADDARKLAQLATMLGKVEQAARFEAMHERVREAFQAKWVLEEGRLAVEQQTAYLVALAFELLPEQVRQQAAEHLVDNIRQLDWHLSTGFIGISHLNPQLTLWGHSEAAYRLLANEDYPSWLYPVLHGATTIWERWNGWTEADGFFDPQMNSFNHYSLGSVSEWLYRHVAGIELDSEIPGFKQFIVKPYPDSSLEYAGAKYRSPHGTIESRWERTTNGLLLGVRIPANTQAEVHLPAGSQDQLRESGLPLSEVAEVKVIRQEEEYSVLSVSAGEYAFEVISR